MVTVHVEFGIRDKSKVAFLKCEVFLASVGVMSLAWLNQNISMLNSIIKLHVTYVWKKLTKTAWFCVDWLKHVDFMKGDKISLVVTHDWMYFYCGGHRKIISNSSFQFICAVTLSYVIYKEQQYLTCSNLVD